MSLRRPSEPAALLAVLIVVAAVGCSGGSGGDGSSASRPPAASPSAMASEAPTSTPPPPTSASPQVSGSPSATATPAPVLEDGKHFGFIRSVDTSAQPATMAFDLAYFLTGEDAVQAAREHGDEYPPPNDYYIVNDNPKLRTLVLDPAVRIRLIDWTECCETFFTGELGTFADAFETPDPSGRYQGRNSSYWLWLRRGEIVRIQEQYLP